MPDLTTLTTKALQLAKLRTVRSQAATHYKELKKQKDQMTALLRSMNHLQQRGMGLATMTINNRINNENLETWKSYYQQNQFLVKLLYPHIMVIVGIMVLITALLRHDAILSLAYIIHAINKSMCMSISVRFFGLFQLWSDGP